MSPCHRVKLDRASHVALVSYRWRAKGTFGPDLLLIYESSDAGYTSIYNAEMPLMDSNVQTPVRYKRYVLSMRHRYYVAVSSK